MSYLNTMQPIPYLGAPLLTQQHRASYAVNVVLMNQIKKQVEYYFRLDNLRNDRYLLGLLNTTERFGAVPLHIICSFPKLRQIHALHLGYSLPTHVTPNVNPQLVAAALQGSSIVSISEDGFWISPKQLPFDSCQNSFGELVESSTSSVASESSSLLGIYTARVHPLPVTERNIILLRDVPRSATADQVKQAFSTKLRTPKSVKPDVGKTWYISFETEEQAMAALLESGGKTIEGEPINGRIKSELATFDDKIPPDIEAPKQPRGEKLLEGNGSTGILPNHQHHLPTVAIPLTHAYPSFISPYQLGMPIPAFPGVAQYWMYPVAYDPSQHLQQFNYHRSPPKTTSCGGNQKYTVDMDQKAKTSHVKKKLPHVEADLYPPKHVYVTPQSNSDRINEPRKVECGSAMHPQLNGKESQNNHVHSSSRFETSIKPSRHGYANGHKGKISKSSTVYNSMKLTTKDISELSFNSTLQGDQRKPKKKKSKNTRPDAKARAKPPIVLNVDSFPPLSGPKASSTPYGKLPSKDRVTTGYAQALLKHPSAKFVVGVRDAKEAKCAEVLRNLSTSRGIGSGNFEDIDGW